MFSEIGFGTAENEPRKVWITDLSENICRSHAERVLLSVAVELRKLGLQYEFIIELS